MNSKMQAGRAIAQLTRNEAACVTSSATGGIVLTVAACVADLDVEKCEQLPNTHGLKRDIIVHHRDRFDEDVAIKIPRARIIEIGDQNAASEEDYEGALTEQTAAVLRLPPRKRCRVAADTRISQS